MEEIIAAIVALVGDLGYLGIFLLMALESSFVPFPSEVVMIPAGFLAQNGELNFLLCVLCGAFGSLFGAFVNYYLAAFFGRAFLLKYGRFVFFTEKTMQKCENFFEHHGHISTLFGRLLPVVRQYISLPAGLAKMNLKIFAIFTFLGAGFWCFILCALGYFLGANRALLEEYLHLITSAIIFIIMLILPIYIYINKKRNK